MNKLLSSGAYRVLLYIFLSTAFQLQRLDAQSLSYREGASVWLASRSVSDLLSQLHAPLYYLILHDWIILTGHSEWTLRFLSALFAILAVPLNWQLARRLVGQKVAADVVALMTALSPLWLWYGREVGFYTFAILLLLLAAYLLLCLLEDRREHRLQFAAAFAMVSIAALYTHPVLWLFIISWIPAALWYNRNSTPRTHFSMSIAVGIPLVVSFPVMAQWLHLSGSSETPDFHSPGTLFENALTLWMTGHSVGPTLATLAGWGGSLLAIAGILAVAWRVMHPQPALWEPGTPSEGWPLLHHWLFLVGWLCLPPLILWLLSTRSPDLSSKFLMFGAPSFFILVSALVGWFWMRRWAGRVVAVAMLLLFLVLFTSADRNLLTDPNFSKADWRGVASYLQEKRRPDEPVLLVSGHASQIFHYYYPSQENVLHLSNSYDAGGDGFLEMETRAKLAETMRGVDNVWLISQHEGVTNPNGLIPRLLQAAGGISYSVPRYVKVALSRWQLPPSGGFDFALEPRQSLGWQFEDGLRLLGWSPPPQALPADDGLFIVLYWGAARPARGDYRLRLRAVDERGFEYGVLDQHMIPAQQPASRWRRDDPYVSVVGIPLEPGTPPGRYWVELELYEEGTGNRVRLRHPAHAGGNEESVIGPLQVAPATVGWLAVGTPHNSRRIGARLLDQHLLAARLALPTQLEAAQQIPVTLWWRTGGALPGATLHFGWTNEEGLVESSAYRLGGADWPGRRWRGGELLMTPFLLEVPDELRPGPTELVVWLSDAAGRESDRVMLAGGTIAPGDAATTPRDAEAAEE